MTATTTTLLPSQSLCPLPSALHAQQRMLLALPVRACLARLRMCHLSYSFACCHGCRPSVLVIFLLCSQVLGWSHSSYGYCDSHASRRTLRMPAPPA